jgi:hypothetical protein
MSQRLINRYRNLWQNTVQPIDDTRINFVSKAAEIKYSSKAMSRKIIDAKKDLQTGYK